MKQPTTVPQSWYLRFVLSCFVIFIAAITCAQDGSKSGNGSSEIVIRGSSNLLPFVEAWIEARPATVTSPAFDIEAHGTSEGIDDLLAGRADIAMASRAMTDEERAAALGQGLDIRETVVARMGIAVIVHKENLVESLTIGNLADIFSGNADGWKNYGGPEQSITVVRKDSGWSPGFFRERIMGDKEYADDAIVVQSKEAVVAEISSRPWSIGFTGMPEALPALDRVNLIKIVRDGTGGDATYALSRPLYFFTTESKKSVNRFIEFVTGPEAQEMITKTGFYKADQTDAVTTE